jgi:hypothetical protein
MHTNKNSDEEGAPRQARVNVGKNKTHASPLAQFFVFPAPFAQRMCPSLPFVKIREDSRLNN